jgi:hypothetical protein
MIDFPRAGTVSSISHRERERSKVVARIDAKA